MSPLLRDRIAVRAMGSRVVPFSFFQIRSVDKEQARVNRADENYRMTVPSAVMEDDDATGQRDKRQTANQLNCAEHRGSRALSNLRDSTACLNLAIQV
jgi:hypothetical protein